MEPLTFRIFVCTRERPAGKSSCAANGSLQILQALKKEIAQRGLNAEVKVQYAGCFDLCDQGPTVVVYPEGIWYTRLTEERVIPFIESQVVKKEKYQPCLVSEEQLNKEFIAIKEKKS